jgi:glucose/arabinose dehydrogenase
VTETPSRPRPRPVSASVIINFGIIAAGLVAIGIVLIMQLGPDDEPATAQLTDLAVELEPVAEGFASPVLLVGAGDGSGHRYVVEQGGRIERLAADGTVEPEPFLDISDRVIHRGEQGLLGLAFHPRYPDEPRFFVAYSQRDGGATSISEFSLPAGAEGSTVESTERTLLSIPQPYANHNGGMLAFDHDGMLLAGIGDGGSAGDPQGHGQDRASLLGALLRLDVDGGWPYATPPDNGFADDPEARPEIHASGLRNPWRFSVDRVSGDIYIGDVGQGRWEEVDILPRGTRKADFGWARMEGPECFGGAACDPTEHTLPAAAYPHVDGELSHCSIIGGYAYRGEAGTLPAGTYLYADYCSGTIWAVPVAQLLADEAAPTVAGRVPDGYGSAVSFGEDDAGELYLITDGGHVLAISAAATIDDPA